MQTLAGFISFGGVVKIVAGADQRNNYVCGATKFIMGPEDEKEALVKVEVGNGGPNSSKLMVRSLEKQLSDALIENFLFMLTN